MSETKKVTAKAIVKSDRMVMVPETELAPVFERLLTSVREDMKDNPYLTEAIKVLAVGGYRSAIGSFWNAVVDDLRNKVMARSLPLFNKSGNFKRDIKTYEDFQNLVSDDDLIDGAYKIGVIGWEAQKILKHAKETRHIFDGHPRSSEPSALKVLAMMDDCARYVLAAEYPMPLVDLDEYLKVLGDPKFDRNLVAVENTLSDLPDLYKTELANRLFSTYVHEATPSILRSNIEFISPVLWAVLPKETKIQVVRRVDVQIKQGNAPATELAFAFVKKVNATPYLSSVARKYRIQPLVVRLDENYGTWKVEEEVVRELLPYAAIVPPDLVAQYVSALVHCYIGHMGQSSQYARTDFYPDGAAPFIPQMFEMFDDRAIEAFVSCVKNSRIVRNRIHYPQKLRRLRALANVVAERMSERFTDREFVECLVDDAKEEAFLKKLPKLD